MQLISVLIGTTKTIITVRGSKLSAAFVNALNTGVSTLVTILTIHAAMTNNMKILVATTATFIAVWAVKFIEEKLTGDKLWMYNATINDDVSTLKSVEGMLKAAGIKLLYNKVTDNLYSLQIFSNNKKESSLIESILDRYDIKYCALETK